MLLGLFLICLTYIECNHDSKNTAINPKMEMESQDTFYCPMHPEIVQNHPGKCPKPECEGMDLVKKFRPDLLHALLKPVNSNVVSSINTIHANFKSIDQIIDAQGFIDYDDRTKHAIASRLNGRIDNLYIRYNYQPIVKGEKILDIYSPALITAQENLVYLINNDPENRSLINAAKQKLVLLGFNDIQIQNIISNKIVLNVVPIYSKWSGHIHETMTKGETNGNESSINDKLKKSKELGVKEGMYVEAGQTLFNVVDPHDVAIYLQIKIKDITKIKLNQDVEFWVNEIPIMSMHGKVNFISPIVNAGSKSVKIRIDINNKEHAHKVGALVNAKINVGVTEGMWVPKKSIINLGKQKIVWLKTDGYFRAQPIETGESDNNWTEIKNGLEPENEIAEDAAFLTDSEGFIKITEDE